ncbi:hypothetical protein CRG98_043632 [Punica granatum]|uniref:Uncharacterized protein n=1 Tax=Punica granatum TaxID=22663 RepID=A0A2I0HWU1_PUNGR|nr:hypothetical protein CRG98_043632 [Punica granatum]
MSVPPPVYMPVSAPIYTAPPPMVFPASTTFAPTHITESFPFPTPQPNISIPYQAPPPLNIPFPESGTPIHAAPMAPLMNFLLQEETEQERRMKKMEETIKALQKGEGSIRQRHQSRAPRFAAVYCELPTYATGCSSICFAPCPVPTAVLLGTAAYPTIPGPAANRPPLHFCSSSDLAICTPDYEISTTGATSSHLTGTTG